MENSYLIVGLGNPGPEYAATRHNAGFLLLEKLAVDWNANWREDRQFKSNLAQTDLHGRRVLLCQPQTYMNASGEAVRDVSSYFKISTSNLLIVVDDADLPLGSIRMRAGGSHGGHHGLESVQKQLGTSSFARLRVGIAPGQRTEGTRQISGFVLGRFAADERSLVDLVLERAAGQVGCWLLHGTSKAMNDFNGTVTVPNNESNIL